MPVAVLPCRFTEDVGWWEDTGAPTGLPGVNRFRQHPKLQCGWTMQEPMLPGLPAGPAAFRGWEGGPPRPCDTSHKRVVLLGSVGCSPGSSWPRVSCRVVGPRQRGPGKGQDPDSHPCPLAGTCGRMLSASLTPHQKGHKVLKYKCFSVFNTSRAKGRRCPSARDCPPPWSYPPSQGAGVPAESHAQGLSPPWLAAMGLRLLKQVSVGK